LLSNENGLEILVDESCLSILFEELSKFIKFYNLEMEISSREVLYKFFKKSYYTRHIFSNNILFCDIELNANDHEKLLTEAEFELNILLMGQFLFNYQDTGKHRPHDVGMNKSHVSFLKGCFRGQEVIARTEHLSKKKKEIISIKTEDEATIKSKKIKTLKEVSLQRGILLSM
jgi:folate-binding protein YgfZ